MSVEIIQNSRDSLGRFQEKKTPRAKRVEIWLEPQLIARVDSCASFWKLVGDASSNACWNDFSPMKTNRQTTYLLDLQ